MTDTTQGKWVVIRARWDDEQPDPETFLVIESAVTTMAVPDDTLHGLYEAIGCRAVDCVTGTIVDLDGTEIHVDVWVDDEGLYASDLPVPNLYASFLAGRPIVGDVVVSACDAEGNTVGLDENECATVELAIAAMAFNR